MTRRFFLQRIKIASAHFTFPPSYAVRKGRPGTMAAKGYAHEDNVNAKLDSNPFYIPGPWFEYMTTGGRVGHCQPDGLIFQPEKGRIVIIEAKLRHCPEAFYQLVNLYGPIVQHVFPAWTLGYQEVVRWYNVHEHFPGPHVLRENISDPPHAKLVGVHILGDK